MPSELKVTQGKIDAIFGAAEIEVRRMGKKSCVMCATLPTGFEIVVSASCVDPENYDPEVGSILCEQRVKDRIWELEGYVLQCFEAERRDE